MIEAMVALFIISFAGLGASEMINSAFSFIGSAQDKLTAKNLAYEGLEVALNVVNTNLIRYGNAACLYLDPAKHPPCNSGNRLEGNYRLIFREPSILEQFDIELDKVSAGDLDLSKDQSLVNESYLLSQKGDFLTFDQNAPPEKKTKFYRMIKIGYDSGGNMAAVSLAQWKRGETVKTMKTQKIIYDKSQFK